MTPKYIQTAIGRALRPTGAHLKEMFSNAGWQYANPRAPSFSDTKFYAREIKSIYLCSTDDAKTLAKELSEA